jgi:hypothetical protein
MPNAALEPYDQPQAAGDAGRRSRPWSLRRLLLGAPGLIVASAVQAASIDVGPDWAVRLDNTIKYSTAIRTAPQSSQLLSLNGDDGDRNFKSGVTSNRTDLLTQFDVSYRDTYGLSASAASWYDTIYNQRNLNNSPATVNAFSVPFNQFTNATNTLHGKNIELLNAFVYGKQTIGTIPISARVGRQTVIWGESLFFATNGIAYAQAPVDVIKAQSVPNTLAKELFMPVGQATVTAQLTTNLSVSGYYQFEWRETRIPASGSYFSTFDAIGDGAERLRFAPTPPGTSLFRGPDLRGQAGDNFGIGARWRPAGLDWDFGLYAAQYTDSQPFLYSAPGQGVNFAIGRVGTFFEIYPRHIQIFALSASTSINDPDVNFAGEISGRHNAPLQSSSTALTIAPGAVADNDKHPLYAIGDTLHAQVSAIVVGGATSAWDGSNWASEVAVARVLQFTENQQAFDPSRRKTAAGLRTVFSPTYFQVLPGLDISVPIGLGWNFMGRAPTTSTFNSTGADRGGDISIGITGTLDAVWQGGLSYTRYIGPPNRNGLTDRDFASLTIQRSF